MLLELLDADAPARGPGPIREALAERRAALAEKLGALEQQLARTVQGTTEAVAGVMETVETTVREVRVAVRETAAAVEGAFDLAEHVRRHPWLALGGAVLLGLAVGKLVGRLRS